MKIHSIGIQTFTHHLLLLRNHMSTVAQLSANLLQNGIQGFHRADALWKFFAEMMGPEHAETIDAIAKDLKDTLGIVLVSDLVRPKLTRAEIEEPFKKRKVKGWVGALENLLGHQFEDLGAALVQPPSSFRHIESSLNKKPKMTSRFAEEEKLGQQLKRTGQLQNLKISKDAILNVIQRPLENGRVRYNDQVAVMDELLRILVVNFGNIGGDLTLFEYLDVYLRFTVGIKPYKADNWVKPLENKLKAARKTDSKVQAIPTHSNPTQPNPSNRTQLLLALHRSRLRYPQRT